MQKLPIGIGVGGLLILVASATLGWIFIPDIIDNKVKEQVQLKNGTDTWDSWQEITVPVHFSFYIFNVTNPEDVERGGRPIVVELGPYVYEQKKVKVNISINEEADTVIYRQLATYYFRQELSDGTEDDLVNIINIPLLILTTQLEALVNCPIVPDVCNYWINSIVNSLFEGGESIVRQNVRVGDLLFDGMDVGAIYTVIEAISNLLGEEVPEEFSGGTFGLQKGTNGTDDGLYEVYSGISDYTQFGNIYKWNNATELSWWGKEGGGDGCNMINGSDGSTFPPFATKDTVLQIYNVELCRSLSLTYDEEVKYKGVDGLRFTPPPEMLMDSVQNPYNLCFCISPEEGCPKSGVVTLAACQSGAPIVASTPHFLDGDATYVNQSIGLVPNRPKHVTFIELEPRTGILLQAAKRIQFNLELKPSKGIDRLKHLPRAMFPILWAEEFAALVDSDISDLKSQLLTPLKAVDIGKWVGIGIGILLIGAAIVIIYARNKKRREVV